MTKRAFDTLKIYLASVPSITEGIGSGYFPDGNWWVKFQIDINHELAWNTVQEFGNVLNYLSISERLPTVFKPVSPPSYLNGGPEQFLSWVIESTEPTFTPEMCASWLEDRVLIIASDLN